MHAWELQRNTAAWVVRLSLQHASSGADGWAASRWMRLALPGHLTVCPGDRLCFCMYAATDLHHRHGQRAGERPILPFLNLAKDDPKTGLSEPVLPCRKPFCVAAARTAVPVQRAEGRGRRQQRGQRAGCLLLAGVCTAPRHRLEAAEAWSAGWCVVRAGWHLAKLHHTIRTSSPACQSARWSTGCPWCLMLRRSPSSVVSAVLCLALLFCPLPSVCCPPAAGFS